MHPRMGMLCIVVGVIGMAMSLLLIPAIWVGVSFAAQQVAIVADQARTPLRQVDETAASVQARLQNLRQTVDEIADQAQSGGGPLERQLAQQLLSVFDQTVGPRYDQFRNAYLELRDRVVAASQALATLRGAFPGLPIPMLPTDDLTQLDSQIQAFDARVQDLRTGLSAGELPESAPGVDALRRAAATVQEMDGTLSTMADSVSDLQARAEQARARLDATQAAAQRALVVVGVALSVLCIYGAVLHAALIAFGRQLRRPALPTYPLPQDGQSSRLRRPETVA